MEFLSVRVAALLKREPLFVTESLLILVYTVAQVNGAVLEVNARRSYESNCAVKCE
jgi:hypothetical protein